MGDKETMNYLNPILSAVGTTGMVDGWSWTVEKSEFPYFDGVRIRLKRGDRVLLTPPSGRMDSLRDYVTEILRAEKDREFFPRPRVLFVGYGRHGKDEAAMALDNFGPFKYAGSFSWAALPHMSALLKLHPMQAWEHRHAHRQFWKDELDKLRLTDQCYLARLVLKTGNAAAGLRDKVELAAVKAEGLFDAIVWINRPGFPADTTVTFTRDDATDWIDNDSTLEVFRERVRAWAKQRFSL